jgi:poly(3-hydroxybutyrate) depolymerase
MTSSGTMGGVPMGDAGPDSGHPVVVNPVPTGGCGKPWTMALGMWVSQPTGCAEGVDSQGTATCQPIPPGSTVPAKATMGSPENRGWWVYLPMGYDPTKTYPVIYEAAGCGDGNYFNAGEDGYPYQTVDDNEAILVGLDYDTYSDLPDCYDTRDPSSNDYSFFPWLMSQIENQFCVDTSKEFISGYGSGASLAEQLGCAFADRLRAEVGVAAGESDLGPALLPACVNHPMASMFVHDFEDPDELYANALPACSHALAQNGCTVTDCSDPTSTTLTSVYVPPTGVTLPPMAQCRQFNGCPPEYPVVFCTTHNNDANDDRIWGVTSLFWDFMTNRLGK